MIIIFEKKKKIQCMPVISARMCLFIFQLTEEFIHLGDRIPIQCDSLLQCFSYDTSHDPFKINWFGVLGKLKWTLPATVGDMIRTKETLPNAKLPRLCVMKMPIPLQD